MIKVKINEVFEVIEGVNEARKLGIGYLDKLRGKYVVDFIEAAYILQSTKGIVIDSSGNPLDLKTLFIKYSRKSIDWAKFSVYYDLRKRGRKVKIGFTENDLIVEYGNERMLIFVTEENIGITVNKLLEWVKYSFSKGFKPLLAVVDMHGDITYYEITEVSLANIKDMF